MDLAGHAASFVEDPGLVCLGHELRVQPGILLPRPQAQDGEAAHDKCLKCDQEPVVEGLLRGVEVEAGRYEKDDRR